jgi:hypothetical protein
MYQSAIRNKKKSVNIVNNYILDSDNEEYALCIKLLGNCRIALITNSGNDVIGIILSLIHISEPTRQVR